MRPKLPNIKSLAPRARNDKTDDPEQIEGAAEPEAEPPKPPPPLSRFLHALPPGGGRARCAWTG